MTKASAPKHTQAAEKTGEREHPYRYAPDLAAQIEQRWQEHWEAHETFRVPNPGEANFDETRPKFYCLDMFPYPSGAGLHVGHPVGYIATDIISRYQRHRGCNVLHPMGWDAFGLPAEQYAIQTGVHPAETTRKAIDTFRKQLKSFGFGYDWSREFATIDPEYYKWTQWIWLRAYHAWFDPEQNKARPISELIDEFRKGIRPVKYDPNAPTGVVRGGLPEQDFGAWDSIDRAQQRQILDSYRLAYLSTQTVNWCPKLGTALANEEVIDGKSERGGYPVYRKPLKQWMFRITAYADRLLEDLDDLDWPDSTKTMQAEWIGRSEGADVDFPLVNAPSGEVQSLYVFTTRPDTIFGATLMVVAPEHPLINAVLESPTNETDARTLKEYVDNAKQRAEVDRVAESKKKTGVFTGVHATNPATGAQIPVWTADYVLMTYGSGAIMAVPAHDQRDHEFAEQFGLEIRTVVEPEEKSDYHDESAFAGEGRNVNSSNNEVSLDGLPTAQAKQTIIDWLERTNRGRRSVQYRLRDWLFSRQRYWGEPFPIVYDEQGNHYPVDEKNLPVTLPDLKDFQPVESDEPMPLLAKAQAWVNTTAGEAGVSPDVLPSDTPVRRETNTMPGWAGSCWYYLRFGDPRNDKRFVSAQAERYWMQGPRQSDFSRSGEKESAQGGVDLYIGGAEHAVLHLLYARFWHKILYDLGEISTPEPFSKLFHQGLLTSWAYQRADKSLVPIDEVEQRDDKFIEKATGEPVTQIEAKMSKSLRNVINPDDIIGEFSADTFRLYEMYMGPLESSKPWNTRDTIGLFRFLQRLWRLVINEDTGDMTLREQPDDEIERHLHRTIAKVGNDIEKLSLNTAIAAMIEFINSATSSGGLTADQLERFVVLLSPFAPHLAEELWSRLGREPSVADAPWPMYDENMLQADTIEMPVQIMGKVRGRVEVPADADEKTIEDIALNDEKITAQLQDKTVRKVIVVPGKIINIVAN